MHRRNMSASYSAHNILGSTAYSNKAVEKSRTIPKPRYESNSNTDEFYAKFFEEDSQRGHSQGPKSERAYRPKKKSRKSKFKNSKHKRNRYDRSESDSLSRDDSSEDEGVIIYAEDSEEEKTRKDKKKKQYRRSRSIETPMAVGTPNPMYAPKFMTPYNPGMGTPMVVPNVYPPVNPYYGYHTPGYIAMAPAAAMTPVPGYGHYYNYTPAMNYSLLRPKFSNYDD